MLLEREVVPAFYARDEHGIPAGWVARMRESMARLTPAFSANRARARVHRERHYLEAAAAFSRNAREGTASSGSNWSAWQATWRAIGGPCTSARCGSEAEAGGWNFEVQVYLDDLHPDSVRVELYAEGRNGRGPFRQIMQREVRWPSEGNGYCFKARVPATRNAGDYTPRVVPYHAEASVPLEAGEILWQR